jgi:murein L,D-transpeptidase YcbB/YkuD
MDSTRLDSFFINYPLLKSSEKSLKSFYSARNYALAWHDTAGRIEQADNLYNRMQNLQAEGLSGKVPYLETVDSLMSDQDTKNLNQTSNTDLLLTGMYFYFAEKVWGGLSEAHLKEVNWYLPRKKIDYEAQLDSLLQTPGGFAHGNEPVYRQYGLLKSALAKYNELASKNDWPVLVGERKSYRAGDSAKIISLIKKRLWLLGDMPDMSETNMFDSALTRA